MSDSTRQRLVWLMEMIDYHGEFAAELAETGFAEDAQRYARLAAHFGRLALQGQEETDDTLKIACAELAGYQDGFDGLPQNATFSSSDENLAYILWFQKARRVRCELIDQIGTLCDRLHTLEQERDGLKVENINLSSALSFEQQKTASLGPPVPACPLCGQLGGSQGDDYDVYPSGPGQHTCSRCGNTAFTPTYYRQVTGQP